MIVEIILIIVALIIVLLYLGIDLVGDFAKEGPKLTFNFKILLFSKIKIYSIAYPREKKKENKKDGEEKQRGKVKIETVELALDSILSFLRVLFDDLKVRKLDFHIDLGLSSYAKTATYVGYIWAVFTFPNTAFENAHLSARPCFGQSIIDFKGEIDIRVNLLKLMVPAFELIKDRNVRKLIKEARK